MKIDKNKQNKTNIIIFLFSIFLYQYTALIFANEYIPNSTEITNNKSTHVEIIIDSDDHPHFSDVKRRCSYYWPYFKGKIKKPDGSILNKIECRRYANLLTLSKGYAPLGVFFRAKIKNNQSDIRSYNWEILGPIVNNSAPIVAKFDSFNAAMIFEVAGKYNVNLQVIFNDGTKVDDRITVTVWPRDGKTYYVDSKLGDDRFNGLSITPDNKCVPINNPIGKCNGPWRSATRGFSVLAPRNWRKKGAKYYTAESICHINESNNIFPYTNSRYGLSRKSVATRSEALRDKKGNYLPTYQANICTSLANLQKVTLKPGDQILFKRGQTFKLETSLLTSTIQNLKKDGHIFQSEPIVSVGHWSNILGIHFGAYGIGKKPFITNTGDSSSFIFHIPGVGLMHLSFQDLEFDLQSSNGPPHNNRASFLFAVGQPINLMLSRINIKRFDQGLLFHNAHGIFINDSNFFDSKVGQLYSETSTDVAFLNNKFDYSGNHIAYTNMSHALVKGNTFSRIAFGRTALRIFGYNPNRITKSIWISDNNFQGWIDPRTSDDCNIASRCQYADGKRYNWSLVEFHPNVPNEDRFMKNIVFKRNLVRNAETLLRVGATHNLLIENNIFDTTDDYGAARIKLHSNFSRRPLKNIIIRDNLFLERSVERMHQSPIIELAEYTNESDNHKQLSIINNNFLNSNNCIVKLKSLKTREEECLLNKSNYNLLSINKSAPYMTVFPNKVTHLKSVKKIEDFINNKLKK